MASNFINRRILGVRLKEILITFLIYMFFAFMYHLTLWVNREGFDDPKDSLFNVLEFLSRSGMH